MTKREYEGTADWWLHRDPDYIRVRLVGDNGDGFTAQMSDLKDWRVFFLTGFLLTFNSQRAHDLAGWVVKRSEKCHATPNEHRSS